MTSRERVLHALHGEIPDRVPLNVFAGWNPGVRQKVNQKYGDVDQFCQKFHIDIVTGVLPRFPFGGPEAHARIADLDKYLQMEPVDPRSPEILQQHCDGDLFLSVKEALQYQQHEKPVFVHTWGVFELSQFLFEKQGRPGTEEALINMLAEKEKTREMYFKLADWSAACAENAIQAGADVIELSDDWGQQNTMLFSPDLWWELIYPATKRIVDIAKKHNIPVLLHSDGDITLILDGIKKLGISGLHPVQESSGMSLQKTREILGPHFCIMGGLDTITALPVMNPQEIQAEVERVFELLKPSGPFIFAGSHMFQDDAPLEVIEAAYRRAYELAPY
ncbi:MAG: hypothetical protein D6814_06070 [Calditrichaeota bacterium]|nr:MAG: hypothetical protein D6814_06070 [Calditrichota bacterium]